ncbi:MAG: RluA family pseudouridine synthase [Bryobacteraceae bacterium]|nr:RluA family pseudouridine synthase [Bryobacteraceae bacterium]
MFELTSVAGKRLDQFVADELPRYSRSRIQDWIKQGFVLVDGAARKASFVLRGAEQIVVHPGHLPPLNASPEDIPLDILYEDAGLVAINKAAGMTVHKGAGVHSGTLVNALLHRYQTLSTVSGDERPGIVHRLDRYTSGVLLVARNDEVHRKLQEQFADRTVEKRYVALVHGHMDADTGTINKAIRRSMIVRFKMQAGEEGRKALTEWRVRQKYESFTLLDVRIGTGRTHQIRVHLASTRHPVAGDKIYGAPPHASGRFFLHAARIEFTNPSTGERQTIEAPMPPELTSWLAELA